jgi:hypothetical protein
MINFKQNLITWMEIPIWPSCLNKTYLMSICEYMLIILALTVENFLDELMKAFEADSENLIKTCPSIFINGKIPRAKDGKNVLQKC